MATDLPASSLDTVDLTDYELFRRGFPHEVFSLLRHQAPVWRHPDTPGAQRFGGGGFWVVSTHAEVEEVSRSHALYRSFEGPKIGEWPPDQLGNIIISMDPPAHTRMRRLVNAGFTPRMVSQLEEKARAWAGAVMDQALEKDQFNFVDDIAYQLPLHLISDIVGIPVADRSWYFEVVRASLDARVPERNLTPDEVRAIDVGIFQYGRDLAEQKRRLPADDVWTKLTTVEVQQEDGSSTRLSEAELDMFFLVLTVAGSETTRDAISGGMAALLQNPDQMELLRREPSAIATAVEEIVRWVSPVTYFRRTAADDIVLRDAEIKAGDRVSLWYPSANRDEAVFEDPFRFDVTRSPNPHVGFGGRGVHHCLGASLARHEIRVMFEELIARTRDVEMLGDLVYQPVGIDSMIAYSPKDLQVRFIPR